jgi:superfamily II DNA or RNA helicase
MPSPDRFIAACKSWSEFFQRVRVLTSKRDQGLVFERLTQLYLQTAPEYVTELQHVWLLREVPADIRKRLNLPAPDEGIDLIARTRRGAYWAVQCKFRSQRDNRLTRRELGTFTSLAFNTCSAIALAVVAHTSTKPVSKRHLMRNTVEIGLDRWQSLDEENCATWKLIRSKLAGRSARPKPRQPRPHQTAAVAAAKAHFVSASKRRGRLIMPCGTGKSLTAYWIADTLKAKTILVAVPSLALIRQSVMDWTREYLAKNLVADWICVCSDESVGNLDRDEFVGEVYDTGLPTHTDPKEIAALLRGPSKGPKIVFTTYQSSPRLAAAARKARIKFDLAILDEAHKTVGKHSKPFATLLSDKRIRVHRRVFMTATERVFRGDHDDVLSMDNEADYGARFFHLSFKEAINQRIICDYKILTIAVSDRSVHELFEENRILNLNFKDLDEAEAQSLAAGIALKRVFQKQGVKHAISFHRSIRAADRFREQQDALNRRGETGPRITTFHISSRKTAGERGDLIREFAACPRALMTNARCLTEGVDIPAIDCVTFADPKQSQIDIVQAAGRALRKYHDKQFGYIMLPLVIPDGVTFEEFTEKTAFRKVARTITALSTQDERIADEFRAIETGSVPTGKIVEIYGDIPTGMKKDFGEFAQAISTKIWERVGSANWRRFEDARAFVHSVGLKAQSAWTHYCKSGKKPPDIPVAPDTVYANAGWSGFGDWLGTNVIATRMRQYRPFAEARAYVHSLGLKSETEWRDYLKTGKKPDDIPAVPGNTYAKAGWTNWGDWLGTDSVASYSRQYRPFSEARNFVQTLGLRLTAEWVNYCKAGQLPADIPRSPEWIYANSGWVGMGDWLGTGSVSRRLRRYQSFNNARVYTLSLGLKSNREWRDYCKSGKRPDDIPTNPDKIYAKSGWSGWGDWLGTNSVASYSRQYRPFSEARRFVQTLGLRSHVDWLNYCKSGKRPDDIPTSPDKTYAKTGWTSWGDWLGTGRVALRLRRFRSFQQARAYVRSLNLKSSGDWFKYSRSGKRPEDIPSNPSDKYLKVGWAGWADWLGCSPKELSSRRDRGVAISLTR